LIVATILAIATEESTCLRWKVAELLVEKCTFQVSGNAPRLEVLRRMAEAFPT